MDSPLLSKSDLVTAEERIYNILVLSSTSWPRIPRKIASSLQTIPLTYGAIGLPSSHKLLYFQRIIYAAGSNLCVFAACCLNAPLQLQKCSNKISFILSYKKSMCCIPVDTCTSNLMCLIHFETGPTYAFCRFDFETLNGILGSYTTNRRN